ncbi:hypothetical protein HK096_006927 [Nowakowskiella sp. JEL0078]|nr:hypothetical protein HK096_006927 [Nowakowskiella sp. JEL0078]
MLLKWVPGYINRPWNVLLAAIRGDLIAGLTVAIIVLPQCLAYSALARLPPVYGIFSAFVPMLAYCFLGSSPFVSIAPVSLLSLLVASTLSKMGIKFDAQINDSQDISIVYATGMSFLMGVITILMGVFNGGKLVARISQTVMLGFISAAAIVIGTAQIESLLGLKKLERTSNAMLLFHRIFNLILTNEYDHQTAIIGVSSLFFLLILQVLSSKVDFIRSAPKPLVVMATMTIVSALLLKFGGWNFPVVGLVPVGLPQFTPPTDMEWNEYIPLLLPCTLMSLLGFMETVAITRKYSEMYGTGVRARQEFFALGGANLIGSFFGCFPVAGGLSRSAVNESSGGSSFLSGFVTVILVALSLTPVITPLVYYIPRATLAAIILIAVIGLIESHDAWILLKLAMIPNTSTEKLIISTSDISTKVRHFVRRYGDLIVSSTTFIITFCVSIEIGIVWGGVVGSLILFLSSDKKGAGSEPPESLFVAITDNQLYSANQGVKPVGAANKNQTHARVFVGALAASSLNFLNTRPFDRELKKYYEEWKCDKVKGASESSPLLSTNSSSLVASINEPLYLVLDISRASYADITGIKSLVRLRNADWWFVVLVGANERLSTSLVEIMEASGLQNSIVQAGGEDTVHISQSKAIIVIGLETVHSAINWISEIEVENQKSEKVSVFIEFS